ncbi:MAG: GTPase ObgE [Candidatus Omnitrophota bacterium]
MFIDQARIYVKAGSGGNGCNSLYRDKYCRFGVPDGGDGGRGSDIIVRAQRNLHTLLDFKYNRHFVGSRGGHGSGKKKKGKGERPVYIRVPCGTMVRDLKADCLLRDLDKDEEQFVVARGGAGGKGNRHRREAEAGEPGEERELLLDLRLIAEVGVVGFPNVGKSTLISRISNARPQIAHYPFTTKSPVLGVVAALDRSFVVADIPGLIEGSSQGRGLGDKFLRHVERTKILIHVVDMSGLEGRDPLEDYKVINRELKSYAKGKGLDMKPQVIAANKMDLEAAAENLKRFLKAKKRKVYEISALKGEGLKELMEGVARKL